MLYNVKCFNFSLAINSDSLSVQRDQDCASVLQREFFAANVSNATERVPSIAEHSG